MADRVEFDQQALNRALVDDISDNRKMIKRDQQAILFLMI